MELLIPTLNKFIGYQFQFLFILLKGVNHEQSSQNSQSTCGSPPPKVWEVCFLKKAFCSNSKEGWLDYLFSWGNPDIEF